MKNSRTSLNKPFYDWIKEVRKADKKIAELEDKLYYYNVKLIGYSSPNFEPRLSSTKPDYKDNRHIWIVKISVTKEEINKFKMILVEYDNLKGDLNINQVNILEKYVKNLFANNEITKSRMYNVINEVSRIYNKKNNELENQIK